MSNPPPSLKWPDNPGEPFLPSHTYTITKHWTIGGGAGGKAKWPGAYGKCTRGHTCVHLDLKKTENIKFFLRE